VLNAGEQLSDHDCETIGPYAMLADCDLSGRDLSYPI